MVIFVCILYSAPQWYFVKLRFPSFLKCYNTTTLYGVVPTNRLFHLENSPRDKRRNQQYFYFRRRTTEVSYDKIVLLV